MREGRPSITNRLPPLWQRHRTIILSGAGSFLVGTGLVFLAAHWMNAGAPHRPTTDHAEPPIVAAAPEIPTPESPATEGEEAPPVSTTAPDVPVPLTIPEVPALTPKSTPERSAALPSWQRFAVAAMPADGKPMIAIIIDDVGLDRPRSHQAMALPGPVTISLMSYAADPQRQADEARAHGHELMMHVPMQPIQAHLDPGPNVLKDSLSPEALQQAIAINLDRFTGYVGINNHMGSQFTQNHAGMTEVMATLRQRGLLFIDSVTIGHSVGLSTAREAGVPSTARDVFIDNDSSRESVGQMLAQVEAVARRKGTVIAIGHPHDGTLAALNAWIPTLAAKGFVLVPVTAVVKARETAAH